RERERRASEEAAEQARGRSEAETRERRAREEAAEQARGWSEAETRERRAREEAAEQARGRSEAETRERERRAREEAAEQARGRSEAETRERRAREEAEEQARGWSEAETRERERRASEEAAEQARGRSEAETRERERRASEEAAEQARGWSEAETRERRAREEAAEQLSSEAVPQGRKGPQAEVRVERPVWERPAGLPPAPVLRGFAAEAGGAFGHTANNQRSLNQRQTFVHREAESRSASGEGQADALTAQASAAEAAKLAEAKLQQLDHAVSQLHKQLQQTEQRQEQAVNAEQQSGSVKEVQASSNSVSSTPSKRPAGEQNMPPDIRSEEPGQTRGAVEPPEPRSPRDNEQNRPVQQKSVSSGQSGTTEREDGTSVQQTNRGERQQQQEGPQPVSTPDRSAQAWPTRKEDSPEPFNPSGKTDSSTAPAGFKSRDSSGELSADDLSGKPAQIQARSDSAAEDSTGGMSRIPHAEVLLSSEREQGPPFIQPLAQNEAVEPVIQGSVSPPNFSDNAVPLREQAEEFHGEWTAQQGLELVSPLEVIRRQPEGTTVSTAVWRRVSRQPEPIFNSSAWAASDAGSAASLAIQAFKQHRQRTSPVPFKAFEAFEAFAAQWQRSSLGWSRPMPDGIAGVGPREGTGLVAGERSDDRQAAEMASSRRFVPIPSKPVSRLEVSSKPEGRLMSGVQPGQPVSLFSSITEPGTAGINGVRLQLHHFIRAVRSFPMSYNEVARSVGLLSSTQLARLAGSSGETAGGPLLSSASERIRPHGAVIQAYADRAGRTGAALQANEAEHQNAAISRQMPWIADSTAPNPFGPAVMPGSASRLMSRLERIVQIPLLLMPALSRQGVEAAWQQRLNGAGLVWRGDGLKGNPAAFARDGLAALARLVEKGAQPNVLQGHRVIQLNSIFRLRPEQQGIVEQFLSPASSGGLSGAAGQLRSFTAALLRQAQEMDGPRPGSLGGLYSPRGAAGQFQSSAFPAYGQMSLYARQGRGLGAALLRALKTNVHPTSVLRLLQTLIYPGTPVSDRSMINQPQLIERHITHITPGPGRSWRTGQTVHSSERLPGSGIIHMSAARERQQSTFVEALGEALGLNYAPHTAVSLAARLPLIFAEGARPELRSLAARQGLLPPALRRSVTPLQRLSAEGEGQLPPAARSALVLAAALNRAEQRRAALHHPQQPEALLASAASPAAAGRAGAISRLLASAKLQHPAQAAASTAAPDRGQKPAPAAVLHRASRPGQSLGSPLGGNGTPAMLEARHAGGRSASVLQQHRIGASPAAARLTTAVRPGMPESVAIRASASLPSASRADVFGGEPVVHRDSRAGEPGRSAFGEPMASPALYSSAASPDMELRRAKQPAPDLRPVEEASNAVRDIQEQVEQVKQQLTKSSLNHLDMDRFVDKVYKELEKRIKLERQRRGL
ncbi:hypothetical protein WBG83_17585, partial [Paenibacillus sp. y28]